MCVDECLELVSVDFRDGCCVGWCVVGGGSGAGGRVLATGAAVGIGLQGVAIKAQLEQIYVQ